LDPPKDEWLFNAVGDEPDRGKWNTAGSALYYLRLTTLVRTDRAGGLLTRSDSLEMIEDKDYRQSALRHPTTPTMGAAIPPPPAPHNRRPEEPVMKQRAEVAPAAASPSGQAGSAYIAALLVLVVLTLIGLSLALITQSEMQIGANERVSQRLFYAANSGIAASTARALTNADYSSTTYPLGRTSAAACRFGMASTSRSRPSFPSSTRPVISARSTTSARTASARSVPSITR
jgi:hypothetical protein